MAQKLNPFSSRQFSDANKVPYSGAQLFIYTAGSATKATTTKDLAGIAAHANPIILNSRGEPADGAGAAQAIWQPEGSVLKLVLAPAGDTDPPTSAISSWDNIAGINDTAVAIDQWVSGPDPTYVSTTSFTLVGDQTSDFHVGRRIKTTNTGGTIYSSIRTVAYTSLTTVTVENDSGTLDSGLSAVSYGLISSENTSTPTFRGALAYSSTGLTYTTAPKTLLLNAEHYDTDGIHSTSTNTGRLTVPAGITRIRLSLTQGISGSTANYINAHLIKNGSAFMSHQQPVDASSIGASVHITYPVLDVVAGDYFEIQNQTDTGTTTLLVNSYQTTFGMELIP